MNLYIRNTSAQPFIVNCRIPEMNKVYILELHPRRTETVRHLNSGQLEALIDHLSRFGGVDRKTLHGRIDDFQGLVYSLDKPISEEEVLAGYEAVADHQQDRAVRQATRAAVAAGTRQTTEHRAKSSEVELEQENGPVKKRARMKVAVDTSVNHSDALPV